MTIDYIAVGKRIKEIRSQQEITQEQLSEYSEISPGYLSKIETGIGKPSLEVLVAISYSLGVSLDDLIYADSKVENYGFVKRTITKMVDECTASEQDLICHMIRSFIEYLTNNGVRLA